MLMSGVKHEKNVFIPKRESHTQTYELLDLISRGFLNRSKITILDGPEQKQLCHILRSLQRDIQNNKFSSIDQSYQNVYALVQEARDALVHENNPQNLNSGRKNR